MAHVKLNNVSLRFRKHLAASGNLKEAAMRLLRPPQWLRKQSADRGEFWGLRDITLSLEKGDRVGIVGHNGAGKSCLLKVISRIYRPSSGTLDVDGRIAPLIEIGGGFIPELSGTENVFLYGAILGLKKKVIRERLKEIVAFSGVEEFLDMPVKYYSTGMLLRLAFAVATEVEPDILIMDELFAGADTDFVDRANKRLEKLVDRSPILILVTHELDYVTRFCNRAVLIDHGRIRMDGSPAEVVARYRGASPSLNSRELSYEAPIV